MKVLIAGRNSYIGCHIGQYILEAEPNSEVCYVSVRDDLWKQADYSQFDAVVFAAAIVHSKEITDPALYDRVNAVLPWEFAKKVKEQGVKRFLFLSSAAVFGIGKALPKGNVITAETPTNPVDLYGKSKLKGENLLSGLMSEDFIVSIVRPMNVYGNNCPGNYIPMLKKIANMLPVLPKAFLEVRQGMVHVDYLSKLCYLVLKEDCSGLYHAQDADLLSSFEILDALSQRMGKKKKALPCHWILSLLSWFGPVNKLFGGVSYDPNLAVCKFGNYAEGDTKHKLLGI